VTSKGTRWYCQDQRTKAPATGQI